MVFAAPVADILFALEHTARFDELTGAKAFAGIDRDTVAAVLTEAGRFATEVVAPLNRVGDLEPARLEGGAVVTPPGFADAYRRWCDGGWNGLAADAALGGQGLPHAVDIAVSEMVNAGSLSFALALLLNQGAASALAAHAGAEIRARYLPRLVSGEWTGTMNLTEPQAGSDLALIRTSATPAGDGRYRIRGQKIFITYGDQDWTENILHLVLARLPDAPEGTRGISLFLVPKRLVGEDGSPGPANDVRCLRLEHKLGIHGSPTCVMAYGEEGEGAVGYLVGEEHRGLAAMFTMMNLARLAVGVQGVAVAERASQEAAAYAAERRQGRRPGDPAGAPVAIAEHPDVARMLTTMRALVAAARAICLNTAVSIDLAAHAESEDERARHRARSDLLTPLAKAFSTDIGVEVASMAIQVHGGAGYIEETGAAQHLRDARILPIYEGTNGIQAIDLAMRKVAGDGGRAAGALIAELGDIAEAASATNEPLFGRTGERLKEAVGDLARTTDWIVATAGGNTDTVLAGATAYLRLFGLAAGGGFITRGALGAARSGEAGDAARAERIGLARYFAECLLAETGSLARSVIGGGDALLAYRHPAAPR